MPASSRPRPGGNALPHSAEPGSPLQHMAKSLEQVIDTWDGINLVECFTRNHFHIDPDYEFRPQQDYLHDIRLMKHHLKCHRSTIKELDRWR